MFLVTCSGLTCFFLSISIGVIYGPGKEDIVDRAVAAGTGLKGIYTGDDIRNAGTPKTAEYVDYLWSLLPNRLNHQTPFKYVGNGWDSGKLVRALDMLKKNALQKLGYSGIYVLKRGAAGVDKQTRGYLRSLFAETGPVMVTRIAPYINGNIPTEAWNVPATGEPLLYELL